MANEVVKKNQPKFSVVIKTDAIQNLINDTLGDKNRAARFVASISSAVASNPTLQECSANTIIVGALLGESLNLSPSPQLGQFYLVPFNNSRKGVKEAQFILGAKGYIQLAIRSGQYKSINAMEIREGEYLGRNNETGEQEFSFIRSDSERLAKPIIGYMASFELVNGFRKKIYWSKEEMEKHADTYSSAFNLKDYKLLLAGQIPEKEKWKYSSYWYKNFDGMAFKTMLRQLISKWGIMSIEMQEAFVKDSAVLRENGDYDYVESNVDETTGEVIESQDVETEIQNVEEIKETLEENKELEVEKISKNKSQLGLDDI